MIQRPTEQGGTVASLKQALSLFKMGAPMHPIFVHFTIALTSASLVFDSLGFFFNKTSLTNAGGWTLLGSAVMTLRLRVPVTVRALHKWRITDCYCDIGNG